VNHPIAALLRGVVAGVVGTGAMTAAQVLPQKLQSADEQPGGGDDEPQDPWEQAPVPALVAKRIAEGVFHKEIPADKIDLVTNVMHWSYGTTWGGVYGLLHERAAERPLRSGMTFGIGVWAMSYLQLVPMGLYQPPWEYDPRELSMDVGYHLAYGAGAGLAHRIAAAA
jgi:uncharacterized membrane protein YagU involved in acid resistance